jgi:hypothetical protein
MGLGGGCRGQEVVHEAKDTPLTFNFLAGNQEAEENKALKAPSVESGAPPFEGRTHRNDGPGDSDIFQRWPKLEGLVADVSEQTR